VRRGPIVVACSEREAGRLVPALEAAGFPVARLKPEQADGERIEALSARILVLETVPTDTPERIEAFWKDRETDDHLPILLLHPPGPTLIPAGLLDEPVDQALTPSDPSEVVARVQGLILTSLIRHYRKTFHDLSQPVTIARAVSQKALKLVPPTHLLHQPLADLDQQVDRIFRILEDLQRKRAE